MTISELWDERGQWQSDAYDRLLSKILVREIVSSETAQGRTDERLVVVHGRPQMGKTELILALIGVREDQRQYIYDLIRGGAKYGNSSTSRIFLYQRSESGDDCFRVSAQNSLVGSVKEDRLLREDELPAYMDGLRRELNQGHVAHDIIRLSIPQKYFEADLDPSHRLGVLDLPGVNSCDEKERPYVERLMQQYASLAAVTVEVCDVAQIQFLARLAIPGIEKDWWLRQEKVLLVLSYFYSKLSDSQRDRLRQVKNAGDFRRETEALCRQAVNQVFLPLDSAAELEGVPLEIFPIELGTSRAEYLKMLSPPEQDVFQTAHRDMMKTLRASIAARKNGRSFILYVRALQDRIIHVESAWQQKSQTDRQLYRNKKQWWEKKREQIGRKQASLEEKIDGWKAAKQEFSEWHESHPLSVGAEALCGILRQYRGGLLGTLPPDAVDKALGEVQAAVLQSIDEYLDISGDLRERDFTPDDEDAWTSLGTELEDGMNRFCQTLFEQFGKKRLIGMAMSKCLQLVREGCLEMQVGWNRAVCRYARTVTDAFEATLASLRGKQNLLDSYKSRASQKIKDHTGRLDRLEEEIRQMDHNIKSDKRQLFKAKSIARSCYQQQRDRLVRRLNRERSPAQRVNLLFLLAAMERDYYDMDI